MGDQKSPKSSATLTPRGSFKKNPALDRIATEMNKIYDNFILISCFNEDKSKILYVNKGFTELTEYKEDDMLGKNGSLEFLLGPDTHPSHLRRLPQAIIHRTKIKLSMVLYKKEGTVFVGRVETQPIRDENGDIILMAISIHLVSNLQNPNSQFLVPHSKTTGGVLSKFRKFTSKVSPVRKTAVEIADPEKATKSKNFGPCDENWIIDCNSSAKVIWNWLVIMGTIYAGVTAPFNAAFYRGDELESTIGDMVIEGMFVFDIILNFRTNYYDRFGQSVRRPKKIAINYLTGWFWIDFISAFPFDVINLFTEATEWGVLLKCARLFRLTKLAVIFEQYSEYSSVILAVNMCVYILLAHWFACIWYVIGIYEYDHGETLWNVGWVYRLLRTNTGIYTFNKPYKQPISPQQLQCYWSAMYFSMSMLTTVGFGNEAGYSVTEKIASCVAMPIFALMHAVVFGNVTAIIQRMYARRFAYDIQQKEMKDFYRIYSVPTALKKKLMEFYTTMWTVHRGINHEKILKDLPEDLKADVCEHIYGDFICLPIFQGAPSDCVKSLALQIHHTFINPGDYLIRTGDVVRSYYFVCSGGLDVTQTDGDISVSVGKGELIGGSLSQGNCKSSVDVKAVTYCELHTLKIDKLIQCLSAYPDFALLFSERLENELAINLTSSFGDDEKEERKVSLWDGNIRKTSQSESESSESERSPLNAIFPFFKAAKLSMPKNRVKSVDLEGTLNSMEILLDTMNTQFKRLSAEVKANQR